MQPVCIKTELILVSKETVRIFYYCFLQAIERKSIFLRLPFIMVGEMVKTTEEIGKTGHVFKTSQCEGTIGYFAERDRLQMQW